MPGRTLSLANGYRYGFNGKEQDRDINSLTAYDYGFRIYNPGIGKFLSVDPLTDKYPFYTPYQFAGNKPIIAVDQDGAEDKYVTYSYNFDPNGNMTTTVTASELKQGSGPNGPGILITYNVNHRKFVKNPNYPNGLDKVLNLPDPTNSYSYSVFISPAEKQKRGIFTRLNDWFESLKGTDADQPGGILFTKPLEENIHDAGGDPYAPSSSYADVMENSDAFIDMVGGFGGAQAENVRRIPRTDGLAKKTLDFFETLSDAIDAGTRLADVYNTAIGQSISSAPEASSNSKINTTNITITKPADVIYTVKRQRKFQMQNNGTVRTSSLNPTKPDTVRKYIYYDRLKPAPKQKSNPDTTHGTNKKQAF